jgi:hypothetical protein
MAVSAGRSSLSVSRPAANAARQRLHAEIARTGVLPMSRTSFVRRNVDLFGPQHELPASQTIAGLITKPGTTPPRSTVTVIGEAPDGFGKRVVWDPADAGLALAVYLAAGDSMGVSIVGVRPTDTIELVEASGLASFAEDIENEGVGAFIGIIAAGANIAAASFGVPEAAPAIAAAEKFAASRFPERQVKTKRRDPFGVEPDTGLKARQEGGVIVCLPQARGIFYSGNEDHQERWIKQPGTRDNAHRPDHVTGAYFLRRKGQREMARVEGNIVIGAWDYFFTDNFGFYRLHMLLRRGNGTFPEPVVD